MREPISIADYDPDWPAAFCSIERQIRTTLSNLVERVDHVGSTSVPGLCAKPRIDAVIVVRSAADIAEAARRLTDAGYESRGNRYDDGMWAFVDGPGMVCQRLYVCAPENAMHRRWSLFRDYLRSHREAADAYGALKRRLAVEFAGDGDGYTRAKGPFIAEIIARASAAPQLPR